MIIDLRTLLEATESRRRLWAVPGVRRIGFGFKECGGQVLPGYALRVYVDARRPARSLPRKERIPAEIDGIPTDVIPLQVDTPSCASRAKPGLQISSENLANAEEKSGSIGCFVQKGGDRYILTNHHVVLARKPDGSTSDPTLFPVYQPKRCNVAGIDLTAPIGQCTETLAFHGVLVLNEGGSARTYTVDCALVKIDANRKRLNALGDLKFNGKIRNLVTEAFMEQGAGSTQHMVLQGPVAVRKVGATTGLTTGLAVEIASVGRPTATSPETLLWEIGIRTVKGEDFQQDVELAADSLDSPGDVVARFAGETITAQQIAGTRKLRFKGTRCSDKGDSGSVWIDDLGAVVGLHFAGSEQRVLTTSSGTSFVAVPTGRARACHIHAVFQRLDLQPADAIEVGPKPTSGASVAVPPDPIPDVSFPPASAQALDARLEHLEAVLTHSAQGMRLLAAVRRHWDEVATLLHHRRRVTVAWHRHKGPAFTAAFMRGLQEAVPRFPSEIGGHRLPDLLRAMHRALIEEGSEDLQRCLSDEGPSLLALAERARGFEELAALLNRKAELV
jgi:hypothetical protein